jgi:hypothetical protein
MANEETGDTTARGEIPHGVELPAAEGGHHQPGTKQSQNLIEGPYVPVYAPHVGSNASPDFAREMRAKRNSPVAEQSFLLFHLLGQLFQQELQRGNEPGLFPGSAL